MSVITDPSLRAFSKPLFKMMHNSVDNSALFFLYIYSTKTRRDATIGISGDENGASADAVGQSTLTTG